MIKKGQVTVYIIVGVSLLLMVGIAVFLLNNISKKTETEISKFADLPIEAREVVQMIDSCLDSSAKEAIYEIGLRGGSKKDSNYSFLYGIDNVYYGLYNKRILLPDKEKLALNLENDIAEKFQGCINFSSYNIKAQTPVVQVTFDDKDILVVMNYPITMAIENSQEKIDRSYKKNYLIQLNKMHSIALEITSEMIRKNGALPISLLMQEEFKIEIVPEEDGAIVVISDDKYTINEKIYEFIFAMDKRGLE